MFSKRKGYSEVRKHIQKEAMDQYLKNRLWNCFSMHYGNMFRRNDLFDYPMKLGIDEITQSMWNNLFKLPIDSRPRGIGDLFYEIWEKYEALPWYGVYDFVEWVANRGGREYTDCVNKVLEEELAAYRLIEGMVIEVTNEQEIEMLEEALQDDRFVGVQEHLKKALKYLSDRVETDYPGSIHQSISAVESIAREITGKPKATLPDAIKELEKDKKIHKALKDGWIKLYGYTSDEDGIRHAMQDVPDLGADEAKYFLLSCTSFINYLKTKI